MSESPPFEALLQAAVAHHLGAPGTLHDLRRLTGGATKTTWSFDADCGGVRRSLILQTTNAGAIEPPTAIAGITPHLTAEQDSAIMRAAEAVGVPAPHVSRYSSPLTDLAKAI
jgi:hypothetical protein